MKRRDSQRTVLKKPSPSTVYLTLTAIMGFANSTMFTTYTVYYVKTLGLNPFQLLMVGTVLEVVFFFVEGPTGVWADTYGRRKSILYGTFIIGAAYVLEGCVPYVGWHLISFFILLLLAEGIRAIGEGFFSGAQHAWLADEIGEDDVGRLFLRGSQIDQVASLIGIGFGVAIANLSLNVPYIAGGCLYLILWVFLLITLSERNFTPRVSHVGPTTGASGTGADSDRGMIHTFWDGVRVVRRSPVLLGMLVVSLCFGAASEGIDRLWGAHFLNTIHFPSLWHLSIATWFGVLAIASHVLGIFAAMWARNRLKLGSQEQLNRALMWLTGLRMILYILFALAGNFTIAVVSFLAASMVSTLQGPLFDTWKVQNIPSNVRATVMSMMSQMDALGQSGGGPVVGLVGTRLNLRVSLVFACILMSPAIAVFMRLIRRGRTSEAGGCEVIAD